MAMITVMAAEALYAEIKEEKATNVRVSFEKRKQPAKLTFLPSLPPPTLDCCILAEQEAAPAGPGGPVGINYIHIHILLQPDTTDVN